MKLGHPAEKRNWLWLTMKGFKLLIGKFELWILKTSYGPKLSGSSVGVGVHDDTDHEIHLTIYDEGVRTPRSDIKAGFHNSLSSTISTRCELFLWIWFPASFPITHNCCRSHNTHYWRRFLSFLFRRSLYSPLFVFILPRLLPSFDLPIFFSHNPLATGLHPTFA